MRVPRGYSDTSRVLDGSRAERRGSAEQAEARESLADEGATAPLHLGGDGIGGRLGGREPGDLEGILAGFAGAGDGDDVGEGDGVLAIVVEGTHPGEGEVLRDREGRGLRRDLRERHGSEVVLHVTEQRIAHRLAEADATGDDRPGHLAERRGAQQDADVGDEAGAVRAHGDRLDVEDGETPPHLGELELAQPGGVGDVGGHIDETEEVVVVALRLRIRCAHSHVSFLPASAADADARLSWQYENVTPRIDASATQWAPQDREGLPLLVLLHGYGADEHDLFGLVPHLPDDIAVAAVAAPLAPSWPMPGRAWYPIDAVSGRSSEDITAAAHALLSWMEEEVDAATPLALLGFSQGAAVALQALRLTPERFGAVAALSGYAAPGALPNDERLRTDRPRVFWGRGTADTVIPEPLIAHTAQWLPDHSALSGRVYPGLGHGISADELLDISAFLTLWRDAP